jgi:hypothetical protein
LRIVFLWLPNRLASCFRGLDAGHSCRNCRLHSAIKVFAYDRHAPVRPDVGALLCVGGLALHIAACDPPRTCILFFGYQYKGIADTIVQ